MAIHHTIRGRLFRLLSSSTSSSNMVQELSMHEFLDEYASKKQIIILGEYHGSKPTIQLQTSIQETMAHSLITPSCSPPSPLASNGKLRVVMEHFSVDMQPMLNRYGNGKNDSSSMTTQELITKYNEIGTEQHNLIPYIPLLESAKNHNHNQRRDSNLPSVPLSNCNNSINDQKKNVTTHDEDNANGTIILHGGFIPRPFARQLYSLVKLNQQEQQRQQRAEEGRNEKDNEDIEKTSEFVQKMKDLNYISPNETLIGTDDHYNYFESLFTQRNIHICGSDETTINATTMPKSTLPQEPSERFRSLFPAQILKDASMAWVVSNLYNNKNNSSNSICAERSSKDKLFIICGVGHMLYSHGVPERIISYINDSSISNSNRIEQDDMLRIACLPVSRGVLTSLSTSGREKKNCRHNSKTEKNEANCDRKNMNQQKKNSSNSDVTEVTRRISSNDNDKDDMEKIISIIRDAYGNADAADICFLYEDDDGEEEDEDRIEESREATSGSKLAIISNIEGQQKNKDDYYIRQETKNVYDRVGSTASQLQEGSLQKAKHILKSLNYTDEEILNGGLDIVNYQGVGCPHRHAHLQPGESVLDLGSGLGVDSIIAANAVGSTGRVIGVDISSECVEHTKKRSQERGMDNILSFLHSPIECIDQLDSGRADAIISNGAFCLLPNKRQGFEECFRLLRSGGRIAICTTVVKDTLKEDVQWPLCMQAFARLGELRKILIEVGFQDVDIDLSDSLMEVEEPYEEEADSDHEENGGSDNGGRYKVHNEEGRKRFRHLENFDMNELCARVVVKARKP